MVLAYSFNLWFCWRPNERSNENLWILQIISAQHLAFIHLIMNDVDISIGRHVTPFPIPLV